MGRHEQREHIFRLLFREGFHPENERAQQMALYFEDEEVLQGITEKERSYIEQKYGHIVEKLPQIDALLNEKTQGWDTTRMGKVDLAILRLAVYEILFDDDVPSGVAINEAVELAKEYGQDASGGFVNAVLAKFVKAG